MDDQNMKQKILISETDKVLLMGSTSIHSFYTKPMLQWFVSEVLAHNESSTVCISRSETWIRIFSKSTGPSSMNKRTPQLHNYDSSSISSNQSSNSSHTSDLINFTANADVSEKQFIDILKCDLKYILDVLEVPYLEKQYVLIFTQENKKLPTYCYILFAENSLSFKNCFKDLHDIAMKNKLYEIGENGRQQNDDADLIRFEVMLLGKINVKTVQPPLSFIDDLVKKIENYHLQHHAHGPQYSSSEQLHDLPHVQPTVETIAMPLEAIPQNQAVENEDKSEPFRQRCQSVTYSPNQPMRRRQRHSSESSVPENTPHRSKIRLLLIGRQSVTLVCPVNTFKTIEIKFSNISKCMQGYNLKDHFGFIANDIKTTNSGTGSSGGKGDVVRRICYVFKCAEEYICEEIMQGLKQAFLTCDNETSPMNEYHMLCIAVNSKQRMPDKLMLASNAIASLNDNERDCVYSHLNELQPNLDTEKLGALMTTLRHTYEVRHVQHKSHIRAHSMNALSQYESPLFFSKKIDHFKSKAKHSLESFFQKGRKKMMELQSDAALFTDQLSENQSSTSGNKPKPNSSSQLAPVTPQKDFSKHKKGLFNHDDSSDGENESEMTQNMPYFFKIYSSINNGTNLDNDIMDNFNPRKKMKEFGPEEIRKVWKWAVTQQVLINKIRKVELQKEIVPQADLKQTSKVKYPSLIPVPEIMQKIWEEIMNLPCEIDGDKKELNIQVLLSAISKGIDRSQRGKVWKFLEEQWVFRASQVRAQPINSVSYANLLQNLTTYQHAILIDIGRTFPNQPFYCQNLGAGQLALFNLLKAYSLTDKEVGYCQGLSFVAGVLLMHTCVEWEAFELLYHLMFQVGCRSMYMPDMKGIRLAVYKLSRLLYDVQNDLYNFFEETGVSILLISTPWFLTMFASTFSLSFVARVFDMVFVSGTEALFRVALCTLIHHKSYIMACKDFEETVNYIRTEIPNMSQESMSAIIEQALQMDIISKLRDYGIEYRLIHKQYSLYMSVNAQYERLSEELEMIKQVNQTVTESNCDLMHQLQSAHKKNAMLQKQISNLASKH